MCVCLLVSFELEIFAFQPSTLVVVVVCVIDVRFKLEHTSFPFTEKALDYNSGRHCILPSLQLPYFIDAHC